MERNELIDILKGILICCVVYGHASALPYFDWFHMPLFFMISGYLMKVPVAENCKAWIKKRFFRLFVPYVTYYFLFMFLTKTRVAWSDIKNLFLSGKNLVLIYGTWWFPVCLFISMVLLYLMVLLGSKKVVLIICCAMYVCAVAFSNIARLFNSDFLFYIPWNIDVCLLIIPYMAVGFLCQNGLKEKTKIILESKWIFILSAFCVVGVLFLDFSGIYKYEFRMKYSQYNNFILPIIVPLAFGVLLYSVAIRIENMKIAFYIKTLGKYSMVIMYTHQFILQTFLKQIDFHSKYINITIKFLVCIVIAVLWGIICDRFKMTRGLFINGNALLTVKEK